MTNQAKRENEVEGKVAIVTGAASGIGRATAALLHARGAHVVAQDIDPEVERLGRDYPGMLHVVGDVADEDAARRAVGLAVDRFGRLDLLVNNAVAFLASDRASFIVGSVVMADGGYSVKI